MAQRLAGDAHRMEFCCESDYTDIWVGWLNISMQMRAPSNSLGGLFCTGVMRGKLPRAKKEQ